MYYLGWSSSRQTSSQHTALIISIYQTKLFFYSYSERTNSLFYVLMFSKYHSPPVYHTENDLVGFFFFYTENYKFTNRNNKKNKEFREKTSRSTLFCSKVYTEVVGTQCVPNVIYTFYEYTRRLTNFFRYENIKKTNINKTRHCWKIRGNYLVNI